MLRRLFAFLANNNGTSAGWSKFFSRDVLSRGCALLRNQPLGCRDLELTAKDRRFRSDIVLPSRTVPCNESDPPRARAGRGGGDLVDERADDRRAFPCESLRPTPRHPACDHGATCIGRGRQVTTHGNCRDSMLLVRFVLRTVSWRDPVHPSPGLICSIAHGRSSQTAISDECRDALGLRGIAATKPCTHRRAARQRSARGLASGRAQCRCPTWLSAGFPALLRPGELPGLLRLRARARHPRPDRGRRRDVGRGICSLPGHRGPRGISGGAIHTLDLIELGARRNGFDAFPRNPCTDGSGTGIPAGSGASGCRPDQVSQRETSPLSRRVFSKIVAGNVREPIALCGAHW